MIPAQRLLPGTTSTLWYVLTIIEQHHCLDQIDDFFTHYGTHQRYQKLSVWVWLGY